MFASRRGSISTPVIKYGKFVIFLQYSYKCVHVKKLTLESPNDSTLAGGEGQGSCGETFNPIYRESPISSVAERSLFPIILYHGTMIA
jgi:hypothetical protein